MRLPVAASVLGLAMIVGCTADGIKNAEKTNNSLSGVKSELIADKAQVQAAVGSLKELVEMPKTDLRPQYATFDENVNALEKSATASRKSARAMADNRETYLAKWRADTAAMTDPELRTKANERIKETAEHFTVIREKLDAADAELGPLVGELKATRNYLSNNLTATGLKDVAGKVGSTGSKAAAVNEKIDAAVVELDKVSDEIAPMPATQTTGEPAM